MAAPALLIVGVGEYVTGYTNDGAADSDKSTGVVALVALHLHARRKLSRVALCGTNGEKLPAVRAHMAAALASYADIDPSRITTFPPDGVIKRHAYLDAVATFAPGDCAIIFTPDDTHYEIACACLARGMHVMITKPPVQRLSEHVALASAANDAKRLCVVEVHKRFDPIYVDARDRAASLGDFSFFTSYMSQPKHQLDTFKSWAGRSSDISYYLNSHHVDFHEWCMQGRARPESVTALHSSGVASRRLGVRTEDTVTLAVQWRNRGPDGTFCGGSLGHATYTASWIAPKADVHSQQRWYYMGQAGEMSVDQAHRGYSSATDTGGFSSLNPLFWKPARDATTGEFAGQRCYGYISFEAFIDAATVCNSGQKEPRDFDSSLPTLNSMTGTTAILHAGRLSLDHRGATIRLAYADDDSCEVTNIILPTDELD